MIVLVLQPRVIALFTVKRLAVVRAALPALVYGVPWMSAGRSVTARSATARRAVPIKRPSRGGRTLIPRSPHTYTVYRAVLVHVALAATPPMWIDSLSQACPLEELVVRLHSQHIAVEVL